MRCKICQNEGHYFAEGRVLSRHFVKFYFCSTCCFIWTEKPYWLDEAYKNPISLTDTGLVGRNIHCSRMALAFLKVGLLKGPILDYAGGYGLFTRILRDHGVDCDWDDLFCTNFFSNEFRYDSAKKYGTVTAFEAIEHQVDPLQFMEKLLKIAPTVLFSTTLLPSPVPRPGEWWYYALDSGQHIAFLSGSSLFRMADKLRVYHVSDGEMHMFSKNKINCLLFRFLMHRPLVSTVLAGL